MAKLKNFTLEGGAIIITAYIAPDGKTAYTVELKPEFDKEGLTHEEFKRFCAEIENDAHWSGVVNDHILDDFEDAWEEGSERDTQQD